MGCRTFRFPRVAPPVGVPTASRESRGSGLRGLDDPPNTPVDPIPTASPQTVSVKELTPPPVQKAGPRVVVLRGFREGVEYRIYDGKNYIGRTADKPADIDLTGQEPPDQVWSSRRHAVIVLDRGGMTIEDLNSLNGTFVNRSKIPPGQKTKLSPGDVIAIGTVQLKVVT